MHLGRWIRVTALLMLGIAAAVPARAGYLRGVASPDGVDVIAVGDSGMIYRSVDGGQLFQKSYQGSTAMRAVAFRQNTILVVGDGGLILRSTDRGLNWTTPTIPGTPQLLAVEMPTASDAFLAGANGTFAHSSDGGATWSVLPTGTAATIRNLRFTDATHGWIVGDGGFIASTANAGGAWTPGTFVTPNALYAIDQLGSRVWAVGANSTCWRSTNGGSSWTPVNLRIDSRSDVRAVTLQAADTVYIGGGGGFLRRSVDDGASWTFLQHELTADLVDMQFVGQRGWVVSSKGAVIMRTQNAGASWAYPIGMNVSRSWVAKKAIEAGSVRGASIALHPLYRNTIYCALGSRFYVSRDDGETWTQFSQLPAGYTKVNAFVVSPKDSMKMAITASPPQAEMYSLDGGGSWQLAANRIFGEYGIPIEMHPDKPDTLFFGGDNSVLYRSVDFGKSWQAYGSKVFRSPCDLIVVPESDSNQVIVADGVTSAGFGDLWRSVDGGINFTKQLTSVSSEIPGLSMSRLNNKRAFATNWSTGGVERSTDGGLDWPQIQTTTNAWGTDVCKEDPNFVVYGVYSGSLGYLSFDGGDTWSSNTLPGSNYSLYARDRGCVLAQQGGSIYKLTTNYQFFPSSTQMLAVVSPNGGETFAAGSTHDVTWTATGIITARVEYQLSPEDPWVLIGEVPGYYGKVSWTLPNVSSGNARVRVSDAVDASPSDESNNDFVIALPLIASATPGLDFGTQLVSQAVVDSVEISNPGTANLDVSAVTTATSQFVASPASFTLAPGEVQQLHVTFTPDAAIAYDDTVKIVSNAGNSPLLELPVTGAGTAAPSLSLASPDGGQLLQYGTTQDITWSSAGVPNVDIDYRTSDFNPWIPIAANVPGVDGTYPWFIPDDPTDRARVRVRESGGGLEDISSTWFVITVPRFHATPYDIKDIGPVLMGDSRSDTLRITNAGTAPLTISSITSDRPTFVLHRTSMVVLAGKADTIGITYSPEATERDTATITFLGDDPATPHQLKVTGFGTIVTGVGDVASAFALGQNLPNPFRGTTRIAYALPHDMDVTLDVYNLQGQRVATLVNGTQPAGRHTVTFSARRHDGSPLPSGVYFYRFRADGFSATRKMLLMH